MVTRAAVPDQPTSVNMTESMPDSVVITVTAPQDTGGMPVTGYSVEYDGGTYHYNIGDSGPLLLLLLIKESWIIPVK